MIGDSIPAALRIAAVFEQLGIDYWLAGSLASSIHGEPRSTHDVDFVVDMPPEQVDALVAALAGDWFVDAGSIRDAVRRRDSFQIVQRDVYSRVDVFVKRDEAFADEQKRRRERHVVDPERGAAIWVTSAADIVLQKLLWYRKGGEVSDLQWRDVLGVLKANPNLDKGYMDRWARQVGVADLLERARVQAGVTPPR